VILLLVVTGPVPGACLIYISEISDRDFIHRIV